MKKLLPILLFLLGTGAGVGAGIFLKPAAAPHDETGEEVAEQHSDEHASAEKEEHSDGPTSEGYEYVKLTNQFVIPIVQKERIASMVVASLSLEVAIGYAEEILAVEPKLRNEFLRVMFDHANMGGFDGAFTEVRNIDILQSALLEVAQKTVGADLVSDVLIFEIARQDY